MALSVVRINKVENANEPVFIEVIVGYGVGLNPCLRPVEVPKNNLRGKIVFQYFRRGVVRPMRKRYPRVCIGGSIDDAVRTVA